jgi:hypothetical protein
MDYIKSILGKDSDKLMFGDIEQFFKTSRIETNIIEFKSFNTQGTLEQKLEGIFQAICSFLNSEGGLLIWGAPEGKKIPNQKGKEFVGELKPLNEKIEKDTLINKISDLITPLPSGVRITILDKNGAFVYLFEVDKSDYSPHQTGNIYYMRIDGQKRPAPHHFIEALFRKIKYPNLGGYIKFESIRYGGGFFYIDIKIFVINHSPLQNEENVTFSLTSLVGKFQRGCLPNRVAIGPNDHQISDEEFAKTLHYGGVTSLDTTLLYDVYDLAEKNCECKLMLMFGGKNSPMKISHYYLRINNLPSAANDLVYKLEENILMHEFGKNKGTEKEKVNVILGRV